MSTDEQFVSWSFYCTIFNRHHLPKGVYFVDSSLRHHSSVFYDWSHAPIVQCRGRWPDHDRGSGIVVDPVHFRFYLDHNDGEIEFYEDSLRAGAQVLYCRETENFLHDLVTSTPALEKEIRRRDDIEGIPGRARIKAAEAQYVAERERARIAALSPAQAKFEQDMRAGLIPYPSASTEPTTSFKLRLGPTLLGKKGRR